MATVARKKSVFPHRRLVEVGGPDRRCAPGGGHVAEFCERRLVRRSKVSAREIFAEAEANPATAPAWDG